MNVYCQATSYYCVQSETGATLRVRGLAKAQGVVARLRAQTGDVWFCYICD